VFGKKWCKFQCLSAIQHTVLHDGQVIVIHMTTDTNKKILCASLVLIISSTEDELYLICMGQAYVSYTVSLKFAYLLSANNAKHNVVS
jgi:hypothetical protein